MSYLSKMYWYSNIVSVNWNGNTLYAYDDLNNYNFVGTRLDLSEMISELSYISVNKIKESIKKKRELA